MKNLNFLLVAIFYIIILLSGCTYYNCDDLGGNIGIDFNFEKNSAALDQRELNTINYLGRLLYCYRGESSLALIVDGHASNDEDNIYKLSYQRAENVLNKIKEIDSKKIITRFVIINKGDTTPIADPSDELGRKINRRVAITLFPTNELDDYMKQERYQ